MSAGERVVRVPKLMGLSRRGEREPARGAAGLRGRVWRWCDLANSADTPPSTLAAQMWSCPPGGRGSLDGAGAARGHVFLGALGGFAVCSSSLAPSLPVLSGGRDLCCPAGSNVRRMFDGSAEGAISASRANMPPAPIEGSWSSGASGAARQASCTGAAPRVVWLCGMGFGSSFVVCVALTAQTKRHSGRAKRHRGDPKRHRDLGVLLALIVEHLEGKRWPAPN